MKNLEPIFVGGDSRSGTTYLLALLNRHEDIHISDESNFVTRLLRIYQDRLVPNSRELKEILNFVFSEKKFADWNLDKTELFELLSKNLPLSFSDFVLAVLRHDRDLKKKNAKLFGIKKGSIILSAGKLHEQFPDSRFIHIVRDGRAVYNSKKKAVHSETGDLFSEDPSHAAFEWKWMINSFDGFQKYHSQSCLEITYERLVQHPGETMKQISSFLGIGAMHDFLEQSDSVNIPEARRHLHPNVNKKPILSRVDAWRTELQEEEIQGFEIIAGAELEKKGYKLHFPTPPDNAKAAPD